MTSFWSDYRPNPWRSLTLKINDVLHIQLIKGPVQKNQNNQWFLKQSSFQISVYTTNRQWFSPRWYTYINMWEWLPKQVDSYYRESHDITCTFDSKKQFQPIKMLIRLGQPRVSTRTWIFIVKDDKWKWPTVPSPASCRKWFDRIFVSYEYSILWYWLWNG